MNTTERRGDLSRSQVDQLLKPVNTSRVVQNAHTKPHLSQQDVLAHLVRVFGFGHFDVEVREAECIFESPMTNSTGKPSWSVGYRALVRLTIRDELQQLVAQYDGGSTGESEGQPSRADSHDLAFKSALSTATKRAAIHLGDQFGLSLYNKGQLAPLVKGTLVGSSARQGEDVQDGLEQQQEDGGRVAERQDADAEAPQAAPTEAAKPPRKRATNGTQATKRKAEPAGDPAARPGAVIPAEEPEPTAVIEPDTTGTKVADEHGTHLQADDGTTVEGSEKPWPEGAPLAQNGEPAGPTDPTPDPVRRAQYETEARAGVSFEDWLQAQLAREAEAAAKRAPAGRPDPDSIDRNDEQAVADYNATHGRELGSYITSNAERERAANADAEAAEERELRQREADEQMARQAELDAAQAFMQAAEEPAAPVAEDAPWSEEPAAPAPEGDAWGDRLAKATRQSDCAQVWHEAASAGQLTTELRLAIVARKDELPA